VWGLVACLWGEPAPGCARNEDCIFIGITTEIPWLVDVTSEQREASPLPIPIAKDRLARHME
jgi:hypothetical protein